MSVDFVQVPPDSTGKMINHKLGFVLAYSSGTIDFKVGDIVVGVSSGTQGIVTHVEGTTASGFIQCEHIHGTTTIWTNGENIQVNGVTNAVAGNQTNYYTPKAIQVGANNSENGQYVDNQGQGYVRFAEGAPQFDAFGKMRVSEATTVAEYIHDYDTLPEQYQDITATAGTITHIAGEAGVKLSCTTASGSQAKRVSHTYHPYLAGRSQLIEMTAAIGDTGKANVKRIWGYGDDDDGVFFQLNGTSLQLVVRNSTGSTAAEVVIDQADWNVDKLDGTGLSGYNADVSKNNIYWIDLQWLGAGTVRFGVVADGLRITCHEQKHANTLNSVYMRTGSLPLYYEQINTGVSASTSEFKFFCGVVKVEGPLKPHYSGFAGALPKKTVTTTGVYLGSFRSKQTLNTFDNRVLAFGELLEFFSDTELVTIKMYKNATLTAATWLGDPDADSSVEFDTGASAISGGRLINQWLLPTGILKQINLSDIFNFQGEMMRRHATITDFDSYSFVVDLETGTTTDIYMTANWKEVRD